MSTSKIVATQMGFIPGESIHRSLIDLMNPLAAEKIVRSGQMLAFYSVKGCQEEDGVDSILLRRFKNRIDETRVPYVSLDYNHINERGLTGAKAARLALDISVDLSADNQSATEANQLGFANNEGLVVARFAPRGEYLNWDGLPEKVLGLQALVASSSPPEEAVAVFVKRELTVRE